MILFGMILLSMLVTTTSCGADETGSSSQGCGRAAPATAPVSIEVGGRTREFISVVPESYDSDVPHRLIFAFHGRTTPNTRVRKYYRIDRERVFAVGHSLGASFANSLGCARGAVIRGVGTVAGRIWDIKCSGPAAEMIMHNPNDDLVPVSRGLKARDWALAQNGLKPPARPCEPRDLNCECYGPPGTPNPVVWCPHTQDLNRQGKFYPHLWPKEAGAAIMEFFDSLPASAQ